MKKLVITADDFGLTKGINDGIYSLIEKKRLRNVSLMVNADFFGDAVSLMASSKKSGISFGLHFNIYEGRPLSTSNNLKPLLDSAGYFLSSLAKIVLAFKMGGNKLLQAVEQELILQVEKLQKYTQISHIDIHKFLAFTPVISITAKIAKKYSIRYIRLPYDPFLRTNIAFSRTYISALLLFYYSKKVLKSLTEVYTIPCAGIRYIGNWQIEDMKNILKNNKYTKLEVVMHPGNVCESLLSNRTRLVSHRQKEIDLLLSDNFSNLLNKYNWQIAGFNDL